MPARPSLKYEHRAREPHRAAALAEKALLELRNASRLGTIAAGAYRERRIRFEQRLARLERKSSGPLLAPCAAESPRESDESNPDRRKGEKFHARIG